MNNIKINETPVRTSRNFRINNIEIDGTSFDSEIGEFNNVSLVGNSEAEVSDFDLTFGLGELPINQIKKNANQKIRFDIKNKTDKDYKAFFEFDKDNFSLVDNIEIVADEETKGTVIIKYNSDSKIAAFHNGLIRVNAKSGSKIKIIIVNLLNNLSINLLSIDNCIEENANICYSIIDFGGKMSITNYYSNLIGDLSENRINTLYLGSENQRFDLNYIGELRGKNSKINIDVQGALGGEAKKNFKGTIDFKKGCKKAIGSENENCLLLTDKAKSIALPMLLCSEEDVEGEHSSSAGKADNKELFYIMSRGFSLKEAMKLLVRAKFNKTIESIKNEEIREEIIGEIEKRL
ncbi:MAG: SufD family Fe-S cluster assembly protein [Clostridia bacterium]|nr:SufD family Fe-S cluster assembly protein [Clostridia bacterium]